MYNFLDFKSFFQFIFEFSVCCYIFHSNFQSTLVISYTHTRVEDSKNCYDTCVLIDLWIDMFGHSISIIIKEKCAVPLYDI